MLELGGYCSNARRIRGEQMTSYLLVETTNGSAASGCLLEQAVAAQP
jgi:hypothetical protein